MYFKSVKNGRVRIVDPWSSLAIHVFNSSWLKVQSKTVNMFLNKNVLMKKLTFYGLAVSKALCVFFLVLTLILILEPSKLFHKITNVSSLLIALKLHGSKKLS